MFSLKKESNMKLNLILLLVHVKDIVPDNIPEWQFHVSNELNASFAHIEGVQFVRVNLIEIITFKIETIRCEIVNEIYWMKSLSELLRFSRVNNEGTGVVIGQSDDAIQAQDSFRLFKEIRQIEPMRRYSRIDQLNWFTVSFTFLCWRRTKMNFKI